MSTLHFLFFLKNFFKNGTQALDLTTSSDSQKLTKMTIFPKKSFLKKLCPILLLALLLPHSSFAQADLQEQEGVLYNRAAAHCYSNLDSLEVGIAQLEQFGETHQYWKANINAYMLGINCADYSYDRKRTYQYLQQADHLLQSQTAYFDTISEKKDILQYLNVSWTNYYYQLGNYPEALAHLEKNYTAIPPKEDQLSAYNLEILNSTLLYEGAIYKQSGDYQQAIEKYNQALHYEQLAAQKRENKPRVALIYKHLAECYEAVEDTQKAGAHYESAYHDFLPEYNVDPQKHKNTAITISNAVGRYYSQQGNFEKAQEFLQQSLSLSEGKQDPMNKETFLLLGAMYQQQKDYAKAADYLENALQLRQSIHGNRHPKVIEANVALADLYAAQNELPKALNYIQTALNSAAEGFTPQNKYDNPPTNDLQASNECIATLGKKAELLLKMHQNTLATTDTEASKNLLLKAFESAELAIALQDKLRQLYDAHTDKQLLMARTYPILESGIATCHDLYAATNEQHYLHTAFEWMEKGKSMVLREALHHTKAKQFAGIPPTLLTQMDSLTGQIAFFEQEIERRYDSNKQWTAVSASKRTQKLLNHVAQTKEEYRQLVAHLENTYPDYYQLKYNQETPRLADLQAQFVGPDEAILEYFVGESDIFALLITQSEAELIKLAKDFPLEQQITQFSQGIYGYHQSAATEQNEQVDIQLRQQYNEAAYLLFSKIFAPIAQQHSLPDKLLIIPDGILGYLPFDCLLSAPTKTINRFDQHPFLLLDHQITYDYSLALHLLNHKQSEADASNLLALAPSFEGPSNLMASRENVLAPLPNNGTEIAAIRKITGGDLLNAGQATKQNFLKKVANYSLLHFATHGILDDQNVNNSFLAFTDTDSSEHNNRLYLGELYNMRLRADMAVLSACNTGTGKLRKGEGIVSLARGFSYAGVPSIIASLWTANDEATPLLMTSFYTYLKQGQAKGEALRAAKIAAIQNGGDMAHPYFWGAFIPIGNMQPLHFNNGLAYWWVLLPFVAFLGFLFFRKKRG